MAFSKDQAESNRTSLDQRIAQAENETKALLPTVKMLLTQSKEISLSDLNGALENIKAAMDANNTPPGLRLKFYTDLIDGIKNNKISQKDIQRMGDHAFKYLETVEWALTPGNITHPVDYAEAGNFAQYHYLSMLSLPNLLANEKLGNTRVRDGKLQRFVTDNGASDESDWIFMVAGLARMGLKLATGMVTAGKLFAKTGSRQGNLIWNSVVRGCPLPGNSFAATTPVRTLAGLVAISALTLGTPVLAFNEQTGQNGYYPITAVHKNVDPDITYLTLTDPEQQSKLQFIETTPEHPFYVQAQADPQPRPRPVGHAELGQAWVGAGHLKIGDKLKQADGTTGIVANVVTLQQTREMFNLTVARFSPPPAPAAPPASP